MTAPEDPRREAARDYVDLGWQVFVLGENKRPLGNCPDCPPHNALDPRTNARHDAEACQCLSCHGFYAATRDLARIDLMLERHPTGLLAIRTGLASGIVVVDAESTSDTPDQPSGVDVLDDWESWVTGPDGEGWSLPSTLRQRTGSGGIHMVYRLPAGLEIKSRNRVLPSVDVKAEGGYVAVPPGGERKWLDSLDTLADPSPRLVDWLRRARGAGRKRDAGRDGERSGDYDFDAYVTNGCPIGARDEFVNEFCFRLRKAGTPRSVAEASLRGAWDKMEQAPGNEFTWHDCIAKLNHVWDTVELESDQDGRSGGQSGGQPGGNVDNDEPGPDADSAGQPGDQEGRQTITARDVGEVGTGPDNPHRNTDRANGIEIANFLQDRVLWVPGMGWLIWDGRRWVTDETRVHMILAGEFIDGLRQLATSGALEARVAETIMGRANRLESIGGLENALKWAGSLLAYEPRKLDVNPWLLNCPNGTLDLRTGELMPHDPTHLITRMCPTPYDPEARDKTWERAIHEALDGDPDRIRLFVRYAGYTLTGDVGEKKLLIVKGPTNTGKSTVTEPLYHVLGNVEHGGYATVWDADVVQADARVNRSEKLSKSRGARMILIGELARGSRFAENFVKQFTGGDTMDARELYRSSYSFRPQAKLWMATNYTPTSPDKALQNRLLLLPFTHVPDERDPNLKRYLDEDVNAHRAILAWAVRACLNWQREGTLGAAPWLEGELASYALDSDPTLQFIEDMCEKVDTYEESSSVVEIWTTYQLKWAPENVRRPLGRNKFAKSLEEHGFKKDRGSPARESRWFGLRIRQDGGNI